MNLRPLALLIPLVLWQCATPPKAVPPRPVEPPAPEVPRGPDDDHRAVDRQEFQASDWRPLPGVAGWKAEASGVNLTLKDGRTLGLTFVAPAVVRWWVPAGPGEAPLSPTARYPAAGVAPKVREADGVLFLDTPGLGVRLTLADLSWTLVRGSQTVLSTAGGPRTAGRRLVQAFTAASAARWSGPGLESSDRWARIWMDRSFAVPALFGAGGPVPFALFLDGTYQSYGRITPNEASLGTLNGGLDLLVSAAPAPAAVVEALSALTGRPGVPPLWAHGTALVLPPSEPGTFLRQEKLSVQTAFGPFRADRPRFQALVPTAFEGPLPDLSLPALRGPWADRAAGTVLPAFPGRTDWDSRFDDGRRDSPLARANGRLPDWAAQALGEAQAARAPGMRPLVLAGSGTLALGRTAFPEVTVTPEDDLALARVLNLGLAGLGTPAVRLDLHDLADPATRPAAFQRLRSWLLAPLLTLDWGPDPAALWTGLPAADRQRLKALLAVRSQFKPLFAQTARQTAATGRPAWVPLWFDSPADPQALAAGDEFLVAGVLLTAPTTGSASTRSVFLPGPGVWFDFWSGEEFGGGRSYELEARPDRPLLFARGGAFVPVREAEVFDEKDVYNPLTIHVFPGGMGAGVYWVDDGVSEAWRAGIATETRLTYEYAQRTMALAHEAVSAPTQVKADPYLLYRLHNVFKPRQVKIAGKAIPLFGDSWGITDTDRSAAWYEGDHTLLVKTFHPERDQTIEMTF